MNVIIGIVLVLGCVFGGFVIEEGHLAALWQPIELLIIGGAATGALANRLVAYDVGLDRLLPEAKHVRIPGIESRTHPVGIGVAEGRDPREVLDDSLTLPANERLVDAEDVGVAVDVNDRLCEGERFLL